MAIQNALTQPDRDHAGNRALKGQPGPARWNSVMGGKAQVQAQDLRLVDGQDGSVTGGPGHAGGDPPIGRVSDRVAAATLADAIAAADSAAAAFPDWSATVPSHRRACLLRAADLVEARKSDFARTMAEETGATARWSDFNIRGAAQILRENAALATQVKGEVIPSDTPGAMALAVRRPAGVVLGIAPWNAPLILGVRAIAAPLVCGNTVVLKSSELSPLTHRMIGEIMEEAGMTDGVVNVVCNAAGDADRVVEALIAHPAVHRISFTGSTRVGRTIARLAAEHLKPALLELGGKAPMIVLSDADLPAAARAAAYGAFFNQGQVCMSTERLIVEEPVAERFAGMVADLARPLVAGDPSTAGAPLGPVIGADAVSRLKDLVEDAVAKGAEIIAGGYFRDTCMDATVIDHVTPAMRIYSEESFGPVAALIRVGSADEAVRVANDTEYGLAASVFSQDFARAYDIAMRIASGICHINASTVQDEAQMPFGGVKASGHGRFGGAAAINEFTDLRWVTFNDRPGGISEQRF